MSCSAFLKGSPIIIFMFSFRYLRVNVQLKYTVLIFTDFVAQQQEKVYKVRNELALNALRIVNGPISPC